MVGAEPRGSSFLAMWLYAQLRFHCISSAHGSNTKYTTSNDMLPYSADFFPTVQCHSCPFYAVTVVNTIKQA